MSDSDDDGQAPAKATIGSGEANALDRRELQDRAIRGAGWTMIHTVTSVPIAFVVNILLARILGVADYGRLAFLMTLMDIVSGIVALGVTTGTLQFGAKAHASGHRDQVRELLSKAQGFRLVFAAPVLTVVVVLVAHVDLPILILALVFGVWVPGFFDGATTCLAIENKTATGAKNAMIVNLLRQVGVVTALLLGGSADVVWAARLALGSIGIGLALLVVDHSYRAAVLRPRLPRHMPLGFWKFVVPTAIATLISTLALSRTEVFFLQWFSDTAAVGLFALAFGLASHIFSPAQALVGPLIPAISGLREVDTAAIVPAFFRTLRTSVILVGALSVVGVPALALLIPALYGSAFSRSAGMFVALSISAGILVAGAPVGAFVLGRLAARTILVVDLIALVVDVVLAVTLIPVMGGWGAVVANMSGALTLLGLLVNSEVRALGLSWRQLLAVARALFIAFGTSVLAWFVLQALDLPAPVAAIVASAASTVAWALLVRVTRAGLSDSDVSALVRVVPAVGQRRTRLVLALVTTHDAT
ncbi:MAG TPA: oligosaccharide flippase family protein [Flexivirga sp.]|uniref:oligosaccharide flippase family protein n=1 Tax=Flexivirga sp. TaxID=1962927 RepID=UPI002BB9AE16|nr:oligosaccharide flippase family protein [Flexivirga sp.]HWC23433.1 oligosaccharide flippase family protein [Flexivirga sp.]